MAILQDFLHVIGVRSKSKNHHSVMTIVRFHFICLCITYHEWMGLMFFLFWEFRK